MTHGGRRFRDGEYWFWYRCHGQTWRFTAEQRISGRFKAPVCPECDMTVDRLGRPVVSRKK